MRDPVTHPASSSVPDPVQVHHNGHTTVLVFPREVDISNAPALRNRCLQLLNQGTPHLILDLQRCRFCDSSGVDVIFRCHLRAQALGTHLAIRLPPTGTVLRALTITGVTHTVPIAPPPSPSPNASSRSRNASSRA